MRLSFVYPVYNEIENLPRLLPETRRISEGLVSDYEVVLVDDGSTDGSGPFIDDLAASFHNVRAVHHKRNRGLGAAVRTGLAHATKDLVLYMDSDFPITVEEARAALSQVAADTDVLIGYRVGRAEGPRREIMSWTYNRLIRWAFGLRLRDVNFAFKLVRRTLLQQMRLRSHGSFIDAEFLLEARRLRAHIHQIGFHYYPRVAGVSKAASAQVVLRILGEAWTYWRRRLRRSLGPPRVIVTADDFGLCEPVNLGVAAAFDQGVLTGASLLPTGHAFEHAVSLARGRPDLDLGVHLALTQTSPLSPAEDVVSLLDDRGRFLPTWSAFLRRYLRGGVRRSHVEAELRAQIARVRQAGLPVSCLDGHQHLHLLPGLLPVVARLAQEFNIGALRCPRQSRGRDARSGPASGRLRRRLEEMALRAACRWGARLVTAHGLLLPDDFRGFREAGAWDADSLAQTFADVDGGLTEICCHPGADDGIADRFPWGYRWEQELSALTSPQVASAVAQNRVALTTYRDSLAHEK
jgi:predicted glycoside hydrolase/deacetylase ChbG (UPF0249 family)